MEGSERSRLASFTCGNAMLRLAVILLLLCVVGGTLISYGTGGIVAKLLDSQLSADQKLAAIRSSIQSWGVFAPLVYVAIVVVEVVVAPIPGAMLYLPGGAIFGGFLGGLLSLIGNVLGSGVACLAMRSLVGRKTTRGFFSNTSLEKYRQAIDQHGTWIVALLRINPLTSTDLVSYAAGLTTMPVWKVMAGTCLGMAPLCFAQSYLSQEIFIALPWLIGPLAVLCLAYVAVVAVVINRLRCKRQAVVVDSE